MGVSHVAENLLAVKCLRAYTRRASGWDKLPSLELAERDAVATQLPHLHAL